MRAKGWLGGLRGLGRAAVELLQAELGALVEDLQRSARELRSGAILSAMGAFFAFWTLGALLYAAIELVTLWLPRWGAALSVGGAFGLIALILFLVARARFRAVESPSQTVSRRLEGHSEWVEQQFLSDSERR